MSYCNKLHAIALSKNASKQVYFDHDKPKSSDNIEQTYTDNKSLWVTTSLDWFEWDDPNNIRARDIETDGRAYRRLSSATEPA